MSSVFVAAPRPKESASLDARSGPAWHGADQAGGSVKGRFLPASTSRRLPPSANSRARLLEGPQPRAMRRPTVNHEMAARLLGELGRIAEALRAASAAGSEHEYRALVAAALRDLAEMRVVCFEALGRSP